MNITGNNLANIETAGFKSSDLVMSTFGEYITNRTDSDGTTKIGSRSYGTEAQVVYSNFMQGSIYSTGRSLDLALNGDGFFTLMNADGVARLTRNGSFFIDDEGFLINDAGSYVMGQNGRISIRDVSDISVNEQGVVFSGRDVSDVLLITVPEETSGIERFENGELSMPEVNMLVFSGKIIQGSLEHSNVSYVEEMTSMIEDSRAFQACSQIVRMADQIMKKTVNEIGQL